MLPPASLQQPRSQNLATRPLDLPPLLEFFKRRCRVGLRESTFQKSHPFHSLHSHQIYYCCPEAISQLSSHKKGNKNALIKNKQILSAHFKHLILNWLSLFYSAKKKEGKILGKEDKMKDVRTMSWCLHHLNLTGSAPAPTKAHLIRQSISPTQLEVYYLGYTEPCPENKK